mgnify:CR=1 FL=1
MIISQVHRIFADIRLALELKKEDCLCLNFDQIQHITLQHSVRYWLLAENADQIYRTLPYCQMQSVFIAPLIGNNSSKIAKLSVNFGNKSNKFNHDAFSFSY